MSGALGIFQRNGSPFWYVRGKVLGVAIYASSKERDAAGALRFAERVENAILETPSKFGAGSDWYPEIPLAPQFRPHNNGEGLPNDPGVYFLWAKGIVEYVGKSAKGLNQRLRLGHHPVLRSDHQISFLLFRPSILAWAESYYIGIARPPLNFGGPCV